MPPVQHHLRGDTVNATDDELDTSERISPCGQRAVRRTSGQGTFQATQGPLASAVVTSLTLASVAKATLASRFDVFVATDIWECDAAEQWVHGCHQLDRLRVLDSDRYPRLAQVFGAHCHPSRPVESRHCRTASSSFFTAVLRDSQCRSRLTSRRREGDAMLT